MQSFVEVRVEPPLNRIRLIAHGVHGPLRWRDLEVSKNTVGEAKPPDEIVEWAVPFRGKN